MFMAREMILDDIQDIIAERKRNPSDDSYVSRLFAKGRDEILKKIGEESSEVIMASKDEDRERLIHEIADLWFHCMVLMTDQEISYPDIFKELEYRHEQRSSR